MRRRLAFAALLTALLTTAVLLSLAHHSAQERHVLALGNVYFDDTVAEIKEKTKDEEFFYNDWEMPVAGYSINGKPYPVVFITADDRLIIAHIFGPWYTDFSVATARFPSDLLETCDRFRDHFTREFGPPDFRIDSLTVEDLAHRATGSDIVLSRWSVGRKSVAVMMSFADDDSSISPVVNIALW